MHVALHGGLAWRHARLCCLGAEAPAACQRRGSKPRTAARRAARHETDTQDDNGLSWHRRCKVVGAVNTWWREVSLDDSLLPDLNLNRLPLFAQVCGCRQGVPSCWFGTHPLCKGEPDCLAGSIQRLNSNGGSQIHSCNASV